MEKKPKPGRDYIGVGCGVLILNAKGEVLLEKRARGEKDESGYWNKPGGAIEYGETAAQAARREMREELGVRIRLTGLLPHTDYFTHGGAHWLSVNFVGVVERGTPTVQEPDKCDELRWFPLDAIPRKSTQTTRESVAHYRAGRMIAIGR